MNRQGDILILETFCLSTYLLYLLSSPLACRNEKADSMVPILMEYGANPCLMDKNRETALEMLSNPKNRNVSSSTKDALEKNLRFSEGKA